MAGCVPCFIIPLILFIFHRYIQPILLKYWNPWEIKPAEGPVEFPGFACPIKKKPKSEAGKTITDKAEEEVKVIEATENPLDGCKIKSQ